MLVLGLGAPKAAAWGPDAQRIIVGAAAQLLRYTYSDAFRVRNTGTTYDKDLLLGAELGPTALGVEYQATSYPDLTDLIAREVQLLRAAREYGAGSYFSFRMGLLGHMVSDAVMPYSLPRDQEERRLKRIIETDIDENVKDYVFRPERTDLIYVRDPQAYFQRLQAYFPEASRIIQADYQSGSEYNGYLLKGGPMFFANAASAVADIWHTVLRPADDPAVDQPPSRTALAWYFVGEIEYLLTQKDNYKEAERAYGNFARVDPGILQAHKRIGELYYDYGKKERAVQEWNVAATMSGSGHEEVIRLLSQYHYDEGKRQYEAGLQKGAPASMLNRALESFTRALEYDPGNGRAAQFRTQTQEQINERDERQQLAVSLVASGNEVLQAAQQAVDAGDFGRAIQTYRTAIETFKQVDDEFEQQRAAAEKGVLEAQEKTSDAYEELFRAADQVIDEGFELEKQDQYSEARNKYAQAKELVGIVPADADDVWIEQRDNLIAEVEAKLKKNEQAEQNYAAQQEAERKRKEQEAAYNKFQAEKKAQEPQNK